MNHKHDPSFGLGHQSAHAFASDRPGATEPGSGQGSAESPGRNTFDAWDQAASTMLERALSLPWLGLRNAVLARLLLLLNHITLQEPEAMRRLQQHRGRRVHVRWRSMVLQLQISDAGLWILQGLDPADAPSVNTTADLHIVLQATLAQALQQRMRGQDLAMHVAGNVQLAAEINWLAQNLRWDFEEDLSRIIGDAPAHRCSQLARIVRERLSQWLANHPLTAHATQS